MIKRLLVVMMLVLSVASFGLETSKTIERKPEKLTLKNFKGAQLGLSEVVSLTSYVGTLSYKKGILYIIANTNEKSSHKENEELAQSRIAFVSGIIDMNTNVNKKGIEYKKISLADTQYSFGRNNLPPVELLFINEEL